MAKWGVGTMRKFGSRLQAKKYLKKNLDFYDSLGINVRNTTHKPTKTSKIKRKSK